MVLIADIDNFFKDLLEDVQQASWDNSGLQIGSYNQRIAHIMFSLSVTAKAVNEAVLRKADLIIAHHPITISGVRHITDKGYPEGIFFELLKKNIAVYSLHTNLDFSKLGPSYLIAEKLNMVDIDFPEIPSAEARIVVGKPDKEITQSDLVNGLKSILPRDIYRGINYNPQKPVGKIAICSGSCASVIEVVSEIADIFITGDVKYHDAIKAEDLGLTVLDMGHFGTEKLFHVNLMAAMRREFPEVDFSVFEDEKSPYGVL